MESYSQFSAVQPVVFRNSRFLILVTLFGSISAFIMAMCMLLMTINYLFLQHGYSFSRLEGVVGWAIGAWSFFMMGPSLWKLAFKMAYAEAKLDEQGVDFRLGTKKSPIGLSLAWNQIVAIKHKRVGNNQTYSVFGKDESYVQYTSYTFFRPKKLARMIAAQSGQPIQEG